MISTGLAALAECDLLISRGTDQTFVFRYSTSDGAEPPVVTPVDLTGWTAKAQLRRRVAGDVWVTLTSASGITLGADGSVEIAIGHALTEAAAWDAYSIGVWDLELASPVGEKVRLVQGAVTVSQDVTRE